MKVTEYAITEPLLNRSGDTANALARATSPGFRMANPDEIPGRANAYTQDKLERDIQAFLADPSALFR
jgi:hypothetical protein